MNRIRPSTFQWNCRAFCNVVVLLVLLALVFWVWPIVHAEASPQTIYVNVDNVGDPDEDGSHDHPFDRIQEAVDVAGSGDTIVVASGVYCEEVVLGKSNAGISLIGEEGTVIDGEGRRSGMRVGIGLSRPNYIDNVAITGFTVRNCVKGITLMRCRYACLRNNTMVGNLYNFADYSLVVNDVDTSNTVDGKPIYYWVDEEDREVPLDAGFVALVNSKNIVVKDLNLINNGQGLLFKNTTCSRIENVSVVNNQDGIYFDLESDNNTIVDSLILDNEVIGIYLSTSSGNIICGNTISRNDYGVYLTTSYGLSTINNVVVGNTIQGHWKGLVLHGEPNNLVIDNFVKNNLVLNNSVAISMHLSAFNRIYHNNFVNNTDQVESYESENAFDYLGEGNYWSDYEGADLYYDGIGDTPYVINHVNRDNFPLMGYFNGFSIVWEGITYSFDAICSSFMFNVSFSQLGKSIVFDVLPGGNEMSFCSVTFPEVVLGGPYMVLVDGSQTATLIEESNGTHAFLFFTYLGYIGRVEIFGETAIPEFSQVLVLSFFMIATLFVGFLHMRVRLQ